MKKFLFNSSALSRVGGPAVRLLKNEKGASLMEYGIVVAMISTVGISAIYATGLKVEGLFQSTSEILAENTDHAVNGPGAPDPMDGLNCYTGTAANDTINASDLSGGFDCVNALAGNDAIAISATSGVSIFPGDGANLISFSGSGNIVYYQGGTDQITDTGSSSTLRMTGINSSDVSWSLDQAPARVRHGRMTGIGIDVRLREQTAVGLGSGFEFVEFDDVTLSWGNVKDNILASQWSNGDDSVHGTENDDDLRGLAGQDNIYGYDGDDTVYYTSGADRIDVGQGNDRVVFSGHNYADVIRVDIGDWQGRIQMLMGNGDNVRLESQFRYEVGHANHRIASFVFDDQTLTDAQMHAEALSRQEAAGESNYRGTMRTETMSPTAGNFEIIPLDGDDTIIYSASSGNIWIRGRDHNGYRNLGDDTLDLSIYTAAQVTAAAIGADIELTTPGGTVLLEDQVALPLGASSMLNIETVQFSDGSWNEAGIRAAAGV